MMRFVLVAMSLFLVAFALAPSAQAIPPVCWGPGLQGEYGPVTIDGYGLSCMQVEVHDEWGPLPDDGTPGAWEGGIAECTEQGCKTIATWTCLGGESPKIQHTTIGPVTLVVHHCTPGPNPGPVIG